MIRSIAGSIARPLAVAITGASGGAAPAPVDAYAANGFEPDFVVDESATSAPFYRSGGTTVGYDDIYTTDTTAGGLCTQNDSSGNLVWGPHNIVQYSEQADNAYWTKTGASITANAATAPDGTTTADQLIEDSATNRHEFARLNVNTSGVVTFAAVIENVDRDWVWLTITDNLGAGTGRVWFNVSTGTKGTEQSGYAGTITALDGGRYLCTITGAGNTFLKPGIGLATGDTVVSYAGDGSSSVYVWGMHLYRSDLGGMADVPADVRSTSALDKYVPTTTAAKYLIRRRHYRYDGTSYVPTLLHEPVGATNHVVDCRDLSTANWIRRGTGSVASTEGAGGDAGGASRITVSTGINDVIEANVSGGRFANNASLAVSCRVKPVSGGSSLEITNAVTSSSGRWIVDLSALPTDRYSLLTEDHPAVTVHNAFSATGTGAASIRFLSSSGSVVVDVDTVQLEAAALPSSSIITNGSTVTRSADTCKVKAAALPSSTSATSYALSGRITYPDDNTGIAGVVLERAVDSNNRVLWYFGTAGADTGEVVVSQRVSGTQDVSTSASDALTPGVMSAAVVAGRHTSGAVQGAVAGTASTADTTPTALPDLSSEDLSVFSSSFGFTARDGELDKLVAWEADIAEAGIEEATA